MGSSTPSLHAADIVRVTYMLIWFRTHGILYAARIIDSFVCHSIQEEKSKPLGKACAEHTENMQDGKRPNVIKAYRKADVPICRALAAFLRERMHRISNHPLFRQCQNKNTFRPPPPQLLSTSKSPKGKYPQIYREKAIRRHWFTYSFPNQEIKYLPVPG